MTRWALTAAAAATSVAVALAAWSAYEPGSIGDDAAYYLGAVSLARSGEYRDLSHPDAVPQRHFLPGYPLLVAPALALSEAPETARVATLAMHALAMALFAWLALAVLPLRWAALASAWLVMLPLSAWLGSAILSEVPYLALSLALLGLAIREGQEPSAGWHPREVALAAGSFALCWIRPVGISLAAALAAAAWRGGRRRAAALHAGAGLAFVASYWLWTRSAPGGTLYTAELGGYLAALGSPLSWLAALARKLAIYAYEGSGLFVPWIELGDGSPAVALGWLLAAVAAAAVGVGAARALRGRAAVLALYAAAHLALLLVWPNQSGRYLWPLAPVLYLLAGLGAARLASQRPRWVETSLLGWGAAVVAGHAAGLAALGAGERELVAQPVPLATFAWLRESTEPRSVVAAEVAATVTLHTGRPSLPLEYASQPDVLMRNLAGRGVGLVLLRPGQGIQRSVGGGSEAKLEALVTSTTRLLETSPLWEERYANPIEGTLVLGLVDPPGRFAEAWALFEEASSQRETRPEAAVPAEAWQRVLDVDSRLLFPKLALAGELYAAGRVEPALELLRRATREWPAYPLARVDHAKLLRAAGREADARRELLQAEALADATRALDEDARVSAEARRLLGSP